MKKIGTILLSLILFIGLFPQITTAAQNPEFEQELTQYLKEISKKRGFEVTIGDIEMSLAYKEDSIENYESVEELSDYLGEVIKADLSNLESIYELYELDKDGLNQLLNDNGEDLTDYIFIDDLDTSVYFYTEDQDFERDPNFEQDLLDYLAKVSKERGFEVTKEEIESSLNIYETNIEEFESVEDLSDFLGKVIKEDLSNLDYFKETYELDKPSILKLLEKKGEEINDYVYIDDLEATIWSSYEGEIPGMDEEIAEDLLPIFQEEIDLTEEELLRIEDHLMSLEEHLSQPETLERLEELGNRMMAFEDFDEVAELTAEQFAELASIYEELLSIFKLKTAFSLIKGGSETPLSLMDIIKIEELKGANLKVALYSTDGQFLADLIITGEMVDSETIIDTGEQIEESAEEVTKTVEQPLVPKTEKQKNINKKKSAHKTIKGAKLPMTASAYIPNALLGLFIVLAGFLMYRKIRQA